MRIFGLTVGRNEEHRYLKPMLKHMHKVLDIHFFYDDRSTDNTFDIAFRSHAITFRRELEPSFIEDEGLFRAAAWSAFEWVCKPQEGDWVLVIDCDEVLVGELPVFGDQPINLNIPEVFGFASDGCPLIRTDRLWGTIHAPRLFPYRPGGTYHPGKFGVPAVPNYVMVPPWNSVESPVLMHYGYARDEDQHVKYQRYAGQKGHSSAHVESILATDKQLVRWEGPYVKEMMPWTPLT